MKNNGLNFHENPVTDLLTLILHFVGHENHNFQNLTEYIESRMDHAYYFSD